GRGGGGGGERAGGGAPTRRRAGGGGRGGPPRQPREARKRGDPDHRRDQDDASRPRQGEIVESVERILKRERAAVRVADQMQRQRSPGAPARLAHRETRRSRPVLPLDVRQRARNRAVRGEPGRDRDVTLP